MTDSWEDNLWTDATRTAYLDAGELAIAALRSHLAVVAATTSSSEEPAIDASAESVRLAFLAMSDAEFNYSSTLAPFSLLEVDDEDEDEPDAETEYDKVSIMLRRDFRLTSESALIDAGKKALAKVSPDEALAADEDVDDLGRAIYHIVHAGGIDALSDVPGIEPVVGVMLALGRDELLSEEDVDELLDDPAELFAGEGEIIYSQSEVWS